MALPSNSGPPKSPPERSSTVIETEEEIRQALRPGSRGPLSDQPIGSGGPGTPTRVISRGASPFRPTARPPVPLLTVFDDGKADGEVIRIREAKFTIGRTE